MTILRKVFSGIQPTGIPHIGNYLGAIKNWTRIQHQAQPGDTTIFSIVDLHSMTTHFDATQRKQDTHQMLASLLACGIDPLRCLVYRQSDVSCHTELSWVLGCLTSPKWLNHMHQWRSKRDKDKENSNLGLYSYPVLMSADILLFKATHVPVGDDQDQHLNLTRHLARAFNDRYGETFPVPETMYTKASRIMSLRDPTSKMSKSEVNVKSRIDLNDSSKTIAKKISAAVTDSEPYISEDLAERPAVKNLVSLYSELSGLSVTEIVQKYQGMQYFTLPFKKDLTELVVAELEPIRSEYNLLMDSPHYLHQILADGSDKARIMAESTLDEVYKKIGFR